MKVLILTGSYGAGHTIASQTLSDMYISRGHTVETLDIAVFLSRAVGKFTQQYYNEFCHEFPAAWKYTDKLLAMKVVLNGMHTIRTPLIQEKFDSYMRKYNPDIIISVFPWWSVFLDQFFRKSTKKIPLAILITDSINIHPFWYANIKKYVDRFFVIDDFSKDILEKNLKKTVAKVITSFFPIEKELFITKNCIKNQKIAFVLSGLNSTFIKEFLTAMQLKTQEIIILKSRNPQAYKKMKDLFGHVKNFTFMEYLPIRKNLHEIDLIVGKPGGAIMSEAIATDTPILIPECLPGQEEGNLELIRKTRAGFYEPDPKKMSLLIEYLDWNAYYNARDIKKIDSCDIIYDECMELIRSI